MSFADDVMGMPVGREDGPISVDRAVDRVRKQCAFVADMTDSVDRMADALVGQRAATPVNEVARPTRGGALGALDAALSDLGSNLAALDRAFGRLTPVVDASLWTDRTEAPLGLEIGGLRARADRHD